MSLDAFVPFHDFFCVYRQSLVGVYYDAEEARVRLQQEAISIISVSEVPGVISIYKLCSYRNISFNKQATRFIN